MDMQQLVELEELFRHRHKTLALICLRAHGPMRWADVSRAMSEQANAPVGDRNVTRALRGLQRAGLVRKIEGSDGNPLYTLTHYGDDRAGRIQDVFGQTG